jgi:ankyrin repeat protein
MHIGARFLTWTSALLLSAAHPVVAGDLDLIEAVKNRDAQVVSTLLQRGVDVNLRQPDGATALHWAAYHDDLEAVNLLLEARADVNVANELGVTPLYLACENGSATVVRRLLAAGARPNAALPSGETPLMTASRSGSADAVQALLGRGADVHAVEKTEAQTALMWAVAEKHPDVTKLLIEAGADVQARSRARPTPTLPLGVVQEGGYTPLLFAARVGDLSSARLLRAAGADVNDAAPLGTSALVVASFSGHTALAKFFLEQGADANAAGAGYGALHAAIVRDDLELVNALLAHQADPNARFTKGSKSGRQAKLWEVPGDLAGSTPFFLAAQLAEADIMRALAEAGADPLAGMANGTTPLMAAAGLLTGGFGRGAADRQGREMDSAEVDLARAQDADSRTILNSGIAAVRLCVELGADVNAVNRNGDSALHGAAKHGFASVLQFLADRGARLDTRNKKGQTAMMVGAASRDGDGEVSVTLLRKLGARE